MSDGEKDKNNELLERLERVVAAFDQLETAGPESRGAILLTLLEAEGIRAKVKKRKKRTR